MSHKATHWLASLPAQELSSSEFRVLFHLCDCHNPASGCFPTQAYLIECCGVSNGTLNNALNNLEAKGLIQRHRVYDGRTKRQKPTRYMLGFELDGSQEPTPVSGDGTDAEPKAKSGEPTPVSGDGADSNLGGDPSPISGGSRLQPTGEVTCKEPVNNQRRAKRAVFFTEDERVDARDVAHLLRAGTPLRADRIRPRAVECALHEKMVTEAMVRAAGVHPDDLRRARR